MHTYKLVVVDPFENYKRGDQIFDQDIINKILDEKNEMHAYDRNVRRVLLSDDEKQIYAEQSKVEKTKKEEPAKEEPVPVKLKTVAAK